MKEKDKEYWQQLNKAFIESSIQFDKQLLYLASGALGLSFAFIREIVNLASAANKWLLISSWCLFSAVIILNIISHYTSLKAINKRIYNLTDNIDNESKKVDLYTKYLNLSMLFIVSIGLIFLLIFVGVNI